MADDIQSNIRINVDTTSAMDSIRLLQNQISAFHQQMSKMGAASAADSRNMQQNLINSINSTGQFAANITKIKTTAEQFSYSLEKNKLTMGEYFRYAGGATKTFGKLFSAEFETINKVARERVKDLQSQYIKLGRDANGAMQAIKVRPLTLDMENLGTKTQIAAQRQQLLNQLLKQGSTNLLNFGKNTQWAGRQLMVGFTVPLSIMGGAAMKAYKEIEEASIRLKRVYGDFGTTAQETEKMVKQVQALALEYTKYGIAVKDSMEVAATAAATGKKGADLLAQIASANKLSALGGIDQQKALQTTISLTDAFSISAKDLGKNINFLNAVENQTVLSIDDLTTAIPKAAPVIQQLGGDVKDLAFFLTAMKEGGINASEGANAIKSGLASIINPTNTASKMLQGFGINLRGIVQANKGDVKKTVVDFAQALDKLDPINRAKAIEQLFGKFQFARMSTLFKNVIEQGSQASEVLKLANQSSLQLSILAQRELGKIEQSPLYKFQKAIADFQAQLAPVGEQFMKAVTPIINFGTDVLKNFNSLGDGVKGFIVQFVAVAGVIGPVLLMSFGLIANAVANVIKGFALVKDIFNKTGKSSMSLGDQVNYMTREQIQAAAIASSLDQVHSKLKQTFTSEAAAVDALTAAYQRSVTAQQAFNVPVIPRTSKGPVRKYAAGGIIRGPGTGTSDSILAMLSNGEAVIPAASVARNPEMVRQLVSGNIPGFSQGTEGVGGKGLPGKLLLLPGGAELSHFSEPQMLPAKDLLETAKKQGATFREIDRIITASGGNMEKTIRAFDSRVERISRELNQMIGDVGSGKTAPKELVARDLVERGRDARSPLMEKMIRAGVSPEKAIKQVDKITSEIESNLNRMEKGALLRAEDINKITNDAYEKVASQSPEVQAAINEQKQISDFKDESGKRGARGQREGFGRNSYIKQRARLGTFMDKLGFASSYGATAFKTTREMEEISGMSGREISKTFKTLTPEQKLKVHAELKNGAAAFTKSLMNEAGNAVVQGIKTSTKQASPSREAHAAGANIGKGAIQGIQSQIDDAKNAGTQVGAAAAQGVSQSGRVPGKGGNRVSSDGNMIFIPGQGYVSEGQLARDQALANAPMQGPKQGTRLQRLKAGMNPDAAYKRIQATSTDDLSTSIRNKSFGAGGALAVGSMFVPGEAGQIMGIASLLSSFAGMGSGGIAKGLKSLSPNVLKLGFQVAKKLPYIGIALTAFELFDNLVVPMIRKNADAFSAISDTLNITKDKIDKINNFFGTELKLTGIRATEIVTGEQSSKQATIAKQFQESQEFKDTYQESAQKMKGLSDTDFKSAMQALAMDLYGQGADEELAKAIIDAIALEAGKSSVSIAPELFSIANPKTKELLNTNIQSIFKESSKLIEELNGQFEASGTGNLFDAAEGEYDNFWMSPYLSDPQDIAEFKASVSELGSYMSALSGQFENGTITAEELSTQYAKIIEMSNQQPGTAGIDAMKAAFITLNAEIGNSIAKLNSMQFGIVSEAILAGVTPTQNSLDAIEYGSEELKQAQTEEFSAALDKVKKNDKERIRLQNQLSGIQKQNNNIANTEQKINDKYDRRIAQIEKIKKLNDQITKSQQGQLTLAEALNRGDVSAAAAAAIDIQQNDVQNALERQRDGLEEAKKAETAPLDAAQEANTTAIDSLTAKINKLNTEGIKVTVKDAPGAEKIIMPEDVIKALNLPDWLKGPAEFIITKELIDVVGSMFGIPTNAANGGHIRGPGTGTSDDIPAMLSNGEYVIRANAVKTIGVNTLDKLNQADRLGFAAGGMVNSFKKKKPKPPKPKPYTLEDLAKPITREEDPDWYDYTHNFLEGTGMPFLSKHKWSDANQGFYRGQDPSNKRGERDILDIEDGKVSFTSVAGAIKYYKALILSRRQAPGYIKTILGDRYWTGYGDKQGTARANSIYNRMFGNYNGLDKAEAKVLASAMTRLWGKDSVKAGFKTLGLSPDLLTNKKMFKDWDVPGQKAWNSYTKNNKEFIPPLLSPNTPKYAMGGLVGYKDGGKAKPNNFLAGLFKSSMDMINFVEDGPFGWWSSAISAGKAGAQTAIDITNLKKNKEVVKELAKQKKERDKTFKLGGAQGFEAGFSGFMQDIALDPVGAGLLSSMGEFLEREKGLNFALSTLSLPVNLIGGGVTGALNAAEAISKGDIGGALTSGIRATGGAFASTYGHIFDPNKDNVYRPQFEIANEAAKRLNLFNAQNDPESAAIGRIIGGGGGTIFDPLTYLGGLGTIKTVGKVSGISKLADVAKTKIATINAKKVLEVMGGKEAGKLTPEVQVKMTRPGLEKFIAEGKYKTIYDDVRSSAGDSIDERKLIEDATGMNRALELTDGQSPAYGFLGTKEAVPDYFNSIYGSVEMGTSAAQQSINNFLRMVNPNSRPLQTYGSSVLNLKPSALKNATVSFGDSLSIYQQAVKAGVKTPQVMKLGSLLTTLRLSSMARKTKGILGNEFSMPYAEIHMRSGFGLDDVSGIGVSTEWVKEVPQAISSMEAILAQAGRSNIPVHDIIGRGKNAFNEIGQNIPKPMPKVFDSKKALGSVAAAVLPPGPKKFEGIITGEQIMGGIMKEFDEAFPMFSGVRVPTSGSMDFPNGMPADFLQYLKLQEAKRGFSHTNPVDAKYMWEYANQKIQQKIYNQLLETNPSDMKGMSFEKYLEEMADREVGFSGDAGIREADAYGKAKLVNLANESFVKNIMGIDNPKNYLYELYRNTRGNMEGLEDAASISGYHSLDKRMAHAFHARDSGGGYKNVGSSITGQYELDELLGPFGTFGSMSLIDEFPILVGPKATQRAIDRGTMAIDDKKLMPNIPQWLGISKDGVSGTGPFRGFNLLNRFDFNAVDALPASTWQELKAALGITGQDFTSMYKTIFPQNNMPKLDNGKISDNSIKRTLQSIVPLDEFGMPGKVGFDFTKLPISATEEVVRQMITLQRFLPEKLIKDRFFPNKYAMGGMVKAASGGIMLNGQIVGGYSMGGMVPKVFAEGGYAMGTDTVPAMLTPGEFVIKKSAVDRIGPSALNKINGYAQGGLVGGTSALMSAESGNPVYNNTYEINVNVRSESNPDQIARTVLTKINQINNHRIRGV